MESEIMASYETKQNCKIRVFESSDEMATDLAEFISQASEISVKERGCFAIALSGGPLIRHMWKLCEAPYNKTLDWSKWYIFWAEERAVAKNHAESNYRLTKEEFLSKVLGEEGPLLCPALHHSWSRPQHVREQGQGRRHRPMLSSLLFLGTWPVVLTLLEHRGRLPQHMYLDYFTNLLATVLIALIFAQLGGTKHNMPKFFTQLSQDN